jgi:hypothetical protein
MQVNPPSCARLQTPMSLKIEALPYRNARTMQGFCTVYMGPPPHVQNFSRRKAVHPNNFQRPTAHARKTGRCKTQKTSSATHFCSSRPKIQAQNYTLATCSIPPICHSAFVIYPAPLHAQNPGGEFCAPRKNPVKYNIHYRTSTILHPAPDPNADSFRNTSFPCTSTQAPLRCLVIGAWSLVISPAPCIPPPPSSQRCSPTPYAIQCCVSPPLTSVGLVAVPATGIVPLHIGAHRRTVRRVRPKVQTLFYG